MKARVLPGQPGQQPHLVVVGQLQALVPAPPGVKAHQPAPVAPLRRHRRDDLPEARRAQPSRAQVVSYLTEICVTQNCAFEHRIAGN